MIRVGAAKESLLITLQIVGDISYAWGDVIENFTLHMQHGVKQDPSLVAKLRATFLKVQMYCNILCGSLFQMVMFHEPVYEKDRYIKFD